MSFVTIKTPEQMDLLALHRVRSRLVGQRTGVTNQIRGFLLERGITVRQGFALLRQALPDILGSSSDTLSHRLVRLISDLMEDWHRLDERIAHVSAEIEALAAQDEHCQRLMSVPGVGPIISSAMVAAIGTGTGFKQGRDFGAWLGLVPKQESTGDRTIQGKISKRGNTYLRDPVRAGRSHRVGESPACSKAEPMAVDRDRRPEAASQHAGDRVGQQARPHCLGGAGPRPCVCGWPMVRRFSCAGMPPSTCPVRRSGWWVNPARRASASTISPTCRPTRR